MNCERVWAIVSIFLILLLRQSSCQTVSRQQKNDSFLLMACKNDSTIQQWNLLDLRKETAFNVDIGGNKRPLTVAYDPAATNGGYIYWTDELTRAVYKYKPAEDSHVVFHRQQNNNSHYGGMAIDTVNRKLYVTDAGNGLVIELELDGATDAVPVNHRIVDWEYASQPRSIAVDPLNKMLYWVDSTSNYTAVYRKPVHCGNKTPFVTRTKLREPTHDLTALAIDLENQILYWVSYLHVGKVALDGTGFASSILGKFDQFYYTAMAVDSSYLFLTRDVGTDKSVSALHVKRRKGDSYEASEESSSCGRPSAIFIYNSSDASRTLSRTEPEDSVCKAATGSPALPGSEPPPQNTVESASTEPTLPFEVSTAAMNHVDDLLNMLKPVTTLAIGVALGAVAAALLIGTIVCCVRRKRTSSSATISTSLDIQNPRSRSAERNVVRYSTMPVAQPHPPPLPPIRSTNGGVASGSTDDYEQPIVNGVPDIAKPQQPKSPGQASLQYMPLEEYFDVSSTSQQDSTSYDTLTQRRRKHSNNKTVNNSGGNQVTLPEEYFDVAPRQREVVETYDYGVVNESATAARPPIPPSRDPYLSVIDDDGEWRT